MIKKPQIVLLPGAWQTPEAFSLIIPLLEKAGYTVHSRQLPSVGNPNPPEDLTQDVAAVRELVAQAIGSSGNDVVVVLHSWAGLVACCALTGLGKKARESEAKKGGVVRTAHMCSLIKPMSASTGDVAPIEAPHWFRIEGKYCLLNPSAAPILYGDLPESEQQKWLSKTTTQSLGTSSPTVTGESWKEIPTSYLLCEDDLVVPMVAQEAMTNVVKDLGGDITVERIKSAHSPFVSMPEYTANWIRKAAGEKV